MSTAGARPIGLDELIALNDEIAALARAGLPMERGLLGFGAEAPGRLGAAATDLAHRLERGEGLAEAIREGGAGLPPTYRAVVEAGLRSGRLASALEDLARFARGYAELRRAIGLAFVYPLMVLLLAYGLFVAFVVAVLPKLLAGFASFGLAVPGATRAATSLGASAWIWGPLVPAVVLALVAAWAWTGRARALRTDRGLRWVPWLRGILADWRASNFAGWLALMVEHGVPLAEAVELASEATGDPALIEAARRIAGASRRGEPAGPSLSSGGESVPPLLAWLLQAGSRQGSLGPALRHAAETYRVRALRRAEMLRTVLPTILLLVIGGGATALYTLALFTPWAGLLELLSRPGT